MNYGHVKSILISSHRAFEMANRFFLFFLLIVNDTNSFSDTIFKKDRLMDISGSRYSSILSEKRGDLIFSY